MRANLSANTPGSRQQLCRIARSAAYGATGVRMHDCVFETGLAGSGDLRQALGRAVSPGQGQAGSCPRHRVLKSSSSGVLRAWARACQVFSAPMVRPCSISMRVRLARPLREASSS